MKVQGDPESPLFIAGPDGDLIAYTDAGGYPAGAEILNVSSGDKANAVATATLGHAASKTTYLQGFDVSFTGATATSTVLLTVTGLVGGTRSYVVVVPAGADVAGTSFSRSFDPPLPASGQDVGIAVSLPALGAGGLHAVVNANGYYV